MINQASTRNRELNKKVDALHNFVSLRVASLPKIKSTFRLCAHIVPTLLDDRQIPLEFD